jgi:hypothetical protein
MRMNRHIINHKNKIMDMGGREEILMERESAILIIQEILLLVISTSPFNPSLNRTTLYRQWSIFIYAQRSTTFLRLRGDQISEEDGMDSRRQR